MNSQQVQSILAIYRSGLGAESDPDVAAALELARTDPELARWFEAHQARQQALRAKLRQMRAPAGLKERILAGPPARKVVGPWRYPTVLALAAGLVLLLSVSRMWFASREANTVESYRRRMARAALLGYNMDLRTNDLSQIRSYLTRKDAPGDYVLPKGLEQLPGVGCAALRWHNQPVSLICFGVGQDELLWLFIIDRGVLVGDVPGPSPRHQAVGKLMTASWTNGNKTYLLARIGTGEALKQFLD